MTAIVGTKGQVVIDKAIRDRLGVSPGWRAYQTLDEGYVKIYFRPPPHNRSLLGSLRKHITPDGAERLTRMSWAEMEDEGWTGIAEERDERLGISSNDPPQQ